MATTTGHLPSRDRLATVLRANGIFSISSGVLGAALSGVWADLFGLDGLQWLIALVGVALVLFGVFGLWVSRADDAILRVGALVISSGDIAWVIATVVLIIAGVFSFAGGAILALAGMVVANFGGAQLWLRSHWLRGPAATGR